MRSAVPRMMPKTTFGHEFVGVVEEVGTDVARFAPGNRVAASRETFCGTCFFCERGWANNCEQGGWELGCRIDGCQAEFERVLRRNRASGAGPLRRLRGRRRRRSRRQRRRVRDDLAHRVPERRRHLGNARARPGAAAARTARTSSSRQGGVDAGDLDEVMAFIEAGKIDRRLISKHTRTTASKWLSPLWA